MPEGPEVWILSKSVNEFYSKERSVSYGKHLFILDKNQNWSFGLTGSVSFDENKELIKTEMGWVNGHQIEYTNLHNEIDKLGYDFMTDDEHLIRKEINTWTNSKKKLAGLLLDQSKISGIGVAWGSEILYKAGLKPDMRACDLNLSELTDHILYIRNEIKNIYENLLKEIGPEQLIKGWFHNLYEIRNMKVYKKGIKMDVLGRTWWV